MKQYIIKEAYTNNYHVLRYNDEKLEDHSIESYYNLNGCINVLESMGYKQVYFEKEYEIKMLNAKEEYERALADYEMAKENPLILSKQELKKFKTITISMMNYMICLIKMSFLKHFENMIDNQNFKREDGENIMVFPKRRNLYYVTDKNGDWFIKGSLNAYERSFTGEIDAAYRTYNKAAAFHILDDCNDKGMNTKVVCISWQATIWNENVTR